MLHFSFSLVLGRNVSSFWVTSCSPFYFLKLKVKYVMCACVRACVCVCVCVSCLVISNLCDPMGCSLPGSSVHRILQAKISKWGCHSLLQGIFPTQRLNPGLLHCRQILYCLSHQGSPGEKLSIDIKKKVWTLRSADLSSNVFHHLLSPSSSMCY